MLYFFTYDAVKIYNLLWINVSQPNGPKFSELCPKNLDDYLFNDIEYDSLSITLSDQRGRLGITASKDKLEPIISRLRQNNLAYLHLILV